MVKAYKISVLIFINSNYSSRHSMMNYIETTNAKTFSDYIYYARLKRNSSENDISFEELIFLYLSLILIFYG